MTPKSLKNDGLKSAINPNLHCPMGSRNGMAMFINHSSQRRRREMHTGLDGGQALTEVICKNIMTCYITAEHYHFIVTAECLSNRFRFRYFI